MNSALFLLGTYLSLASLNPQQLNSTLDQQLWQSFKQEHGKQYESSLVESMRRTIFTHNLNRINEFNAYQAKEMGFSLDINHLTDMSELELKEINGFRAPNDGRLMKNTYYGQRFLQNILDDNSTEVPDSIDWRQVPGRVSKVKNQGACGSCWAFATIGTLEGQEKPQKKLADNETYPLELSEQNLVDCDTIDHGCQGGYMSDALNFIHQEGGVDDEQSYPYRGYPSKCRFNKERVAFTDNGASILPEGDEEALKKVVAKFGPVAVAIDASSIWFQFYRHGVYTNKHCKKALNELDHGVLVVGYGTDPKKGDYWIVKNSWGPRYGEKGYIRMARNKNNMCGIATVATIPTF